jgi:hypothetical protein
VSEQKHTPGTWTVQHNEKHPRVIGDGGRTVVAEVQREHDARLIAAAPDLLWYLRELMEATETLSRRHGYKRPECLPYCNQAITKATGEA